MTGDLDEVRLWSVTTTTRDVEREVSAADPSFSAAAQARGALASLSVPDRAESNIDLPSTAVNGSTLSWTSSDPDVLSDTGIVTRGDKDVQVRLDAVAAFGSATARKTCTVTVPKRDTTPLSFAGLHESDMSAVTVSDAYLRNAAQKEIAYLLHFDTDRLLVEFRKQAGLDTKGKKNYGGWERGYGEGTRFTGHFVGHYISALSEARRSTFATPEQGRQLESKLEAMVSGVRQAQQAYARKDPANKGFLPAFRVSALPNGADGLLVPFYNLHKVEQGLVDVSKWSSDPATRQEAKSAAVDFATFIVSWKNAHPKVNMLSTEYGGMNDALYQVAQIADPADKATVLTAAHYFDETSLFRTLASGKDNLNGLHANTTIPKLTGAVQRYVTYAQDPALSATLSDNDRAELTGVYLKAAENFWTFVTRDRSYANGDNSQSEHFHVSGELWRDATQHGDPASGGGYSDNSTSETCNAHNMLKLTRLLLQVTKKAQYSEYYEHTYINAILASQNPETGMTTYFQPMKAGYPKVFGVPEGEFWCCQGTGIENFSKLADSFYFTDEHDIYVTMFRSSVFSDTRHNIRLAQSADVPKQETVTFTVSALDASKPVDPQARLRLRVPSWSADPSLSVDGRGVDTSAVDADGWLTVPVSAGTTITYTLPAHVGYTTAPDNHNWVSFTYGPLALAGELTPTDPAKNYGYGGVRVRTAAYDAKANAMAAIFPGEKADGTPVASADWLKDLSAHLVRTDSPTDGKDLSFRLTGAGTAADGVRLRPYYSLYTTTYALYFDIADVDSTAYQQMILSEKDSQREQAVTLGSVTPDQGNNIETGANLQHSSDSSSASYDGRFYRDARKGGWFSYDLPVRPDAAKGYVQVDYSTADAGRSFGLYADPTPLSGADMKAGRRSPAARRIATVTIDDKAGKNVFYRASYEIPEDLLAQAKSWKMRFFFVSDGGLVGGVYGVRTVTALAYSSDAALAGLSFTPGTLSPAFDARTGSYILAVPAGRKSVSLSLKVRDPGAYVTVDDVVIDDTRSRTIPVGSAPTTVEIESVAQDHSAVRHYSVTLVPAGTKAPDRTKPVVDYPFDSVTGGTVANHGTGGSALDRRIVGQGVSTVSDGADGTALYLSGGAAGSDSGHVAIPAGVVTAGQKDITISVRMRWDGLNGCVYPFNMGRGNRDYLSWIVSCGGNTRMEASKDGSQTQLTGTTPTAGTWVRGDVVVKGGTSIAYYRDGRLVSLVPTTLTAADFLGTTGASGYLGKSFYNDPYFGGDLDDFRIWNRAVSAAELFGGSEAGDTGGTIPWTPLQPSKPAKPDTPGETIPWTPLGPSKPAKPDTGGTTGGSTGGTGASGSGTDAQPGRSGSSASGASRGARPVSGARHSERGGLVSTGSAVVGVVALAAVLVAAGVTVLASRRAVPRHAHGSGRIGS